MRNPNFRVPQRVVPMPPAFHAPMGALGAPIAPVPNPGADWVRGQTLAQGVQFPQQYRAMLDPPDNMQRAQNPGIQWEQAQVYYPTPWLPIDPNNQIGRQPRDYVKQFLNQTVNQEASDSWSFPFPTVIYGLSAAAVDTTGAALPVGLDPRDTFLVRLSYNSQESFQTIPALGSAVFGTASLPRLVGGPAYWVDRGATVQIAVTPLRSNLRITLVAWAIETRGPTGISNA